MTNDRLVQAIYLNIHKNGMFVQETAEQTYCEDEGRYVAELASVLERSADHSAVDSWLIDS
jgi:methionyl-tRNA synthetase